MNTKRNRKGGGRDGGPKQKRPYSTIDLKATEVSTEAEASAAKADKEKSPPGIAPPTTARPAKASAAKSPTSPGATPNKPAPKPARTPTGPLASAGKPSNAGASVPVMGASAASGAGGKTGSKSSSARPPGRGASAKPAAPNAANAPQNVKSSGGGFFSHMSAGVLGAVLALFGATYAGKFLDLPGAFQAAPDASIAANTAKRIAAIEKKLSAGEAGSDANSGLAAKLAATQAQLSKLDQMSQTISELKAAQAKLQADSQAALLKLTEGSSVGPALDGRLAQLEQTLAALGAAASSDPDNAGRIPQLAALSGRINDLESALKTRITTLRQDIVQEVDKRVAVASETSEAAKSGTQRLDRDVNDLRASTAKMDQRLIDLQSANRQMRESLRVVQEETGDLKASVEGLKSDLLAKYEATARPADVAAMISPITSKINSLEQNLQGVVKSEANRTSNAQRIVLALELGNLKRTMDRGLTFEAELAEVKRAARGRIELGALEDHKSTGVPALGDLQRGFRSIAFKMIDAAAMKENSTIVDQLLRGAKSMVRIRKINHSPDDTTPEAIVGRMDVALKDGRLTDVLAEAAKLPAKARAPAKDWLSKVKARQSVDHALASIEAKLKSSLSGNATGGKG